MKITSWICALALCGVFLSVPVFAGTEAILARGFEPNKAYHVDEFDAVNTLNGELLVNVPLGPTYQTNGTLGYRFSVRHYDDAWAFRDFYAVDAAQTQFSTEFVERGRATYLYNGRIVSVGFAQYGRMIFDTETPSSAGFAGAEALPTGNAGMGWQFSLGHFASTPADEPQLQGVYKGTYTDPQGTSHSFYATMHDADASGTEGVGYTQDNSYMRLRVIGENTLIREVDLPDGTVKRFHCVARCNDWNADWQLQWTADPHGNVLLVERDPRPENGGLWVWRLIEGSLPAGETGAGPRYYTETDRTAIKEVRRHKVTFLLRNGFSAYPQLAERLESLDLAGPSGNESLHYQFHYVEKPVLRPNVRPWIKSEDLLYQYNSDKSITVEVLDRIELPPGGGKWSFTYHRGSKDDGVGIGYEFCMDASQPSGCPTNPGAKYPTSAKAGRLESVRAPAGGGYKYDYGTRLFPKLQCRLSRVRGESYGGGVTIGVKSRTEIDASGAEVKRLTEEQNGQSQEVTVRWLYAGSGYARAFIDANNDGFDDGDTNHNGQSGEIGDTPICRWPQEFIASVLDPNGLLTLNYYNAQLNDPGYGAPYSGDASRNDTVTRPGSAPVTRPLMREVWQVADKSATSEWATNLSDTVRRLFRQYRDSADATPEATRLRSAYGTFAWSDQRCVDSGSGILDCRPINLRMTSQHTRYHDDGIDAANCDVSGKPVTESFVETVHTDFDGLGHFRQEHVFGNTRAVGLTSPGLEHWDHRAMYTKYNSGVTFTAGHAMPVGFPAPASPWFVNTFTRTTVLEKIPGSTSSSQFKTSINTTLYDFDPGRGHLRATRKLTNHRLGTELPFDTSSVAGVAVPTAANDLLSKISRRNELAPGDVVETVVRESSYGGDGGGLSSGSTLDGQFDTNGNGPQYRTENRYRQGVVVATDYLCDETTVFARVHEAVLAPSMKVGLPESIADSSGLRTRYAYDAVGRVTQVTPPGTAVTPQTYSYTVASTNPNPQNGVNRIVVSRNGGKEQTFRYDGLGRLTEATTTGAGGLSTRSYTYSVAGRMQTETLSGGGTIKHTYDPLGREIRRKDAAGKFTENAYCGVRTLVTKIKGIASSTANEAQYSKRFDAFGRVTEASDNIARAEYDYDAGSNVTKVTLNPFGNRNDTQVREFGYDGRGFVATARHPELMEPGTNAQVQVRNTYDARGHVTATDHDWVNAPGRPASALFEWRLRYQYDAAERLLNVTQPRGANQLPLKSFRYYENGDRFGRRNQLESATRYNYFPDPSKTQGTASISVTSANAYYDCLNSLDCSGLLKSETTTATGVTEGLGTTKTILTGTTWYSYDERLNLARIDYPKRDAADPGRVVHFGYDKDDLIGVTLDAPWPGGTRMATMSYHVTGMPHVIQYAAAAAKDTILPDGSGLPRPGKIDWQWSGGQSSTDAIVYDGAGSISAIGSDTYRYDAALRLVSATVSGKSQSYEYDPFGNMTRMNGPAANRTFAVSPQTNRMTGSGFTYDETGNVTSLPGLSMSYDAFQSMTQSEGPNVGRVFVYDAGDERVGTIEYKPVKRELWTFRDGGNRVLRDYERTTDAADAPVWRWKKDYVYRDTTLSNTISSEGIRDIHVDHLGSTRFVTDAAGKLVGAGASSSGNKFFPFGQLVFPRILDERPAFSGHERDDDGVAGNTHDLDYMHARYYSPHFARFLSMDPHLNADAVMAMPQRWNRYSYVSNGPLSKIDPDGRDEHAIEFRLGYAQGYRDDPARDLKQAGFLASTATMVLGGPALLRGAHWLYKGGRFLYVNAQTALTYPEITIPLTKFIADLGGVDLPGAPRVGASQLSRVTEDELARMMAIFFGRGADTERILHYEVTGYVRVDGTTYTRIIKNIMSADKRNFPALLKAFEAEAKANGATTVRIIGQDIIELDFLNPKILERYGYRVGRFSRRSVEFVKELE